MLTQNPTEALLKQRHHMGEAMRRWSEREWDHCLYSFYRNDAKVEAIQSFKKKYPDRTENAIRSKFFHEKINVETYLGSGLGRNKATKQQLIQELKHTYKILGEPFNKKQFTEISETTYETLVGYFGSWEAAIRESGLTNKFDNFTDVAKEIKEFKPEEEIQKNWKKEKELLLKKAEDKKIAWLKNQANKVDLINEMLTEAVAKMEPLFVEVNRKPKVQSSRLKPACTLWFEFSDLQLGTLITSEEMGGINSHNWIIWQEKLAIWKNKVIEKIYFYHQHYTIDRVVISALGDMVEGSSIFKGQTWKIDTHVVDQAINGANDTAAAFTEIMLTYPEIHFDLLEVFGNHGRIGDKGENPYNCSMDKVYQRMLQGQLDKVRGLTNYTYHQNEAWFYFIEIYGWNHLMLHGDQGMNKLWSGRPTIAGLERGVSRYNQIFQKQIHFVHCGHFHNDVTLSFNLSQILINGSFVGTSNFSATQMVASSPPIQVMHVFEPRVGLYATERIFLTNDNVRKSLEPKKLV